MGQKKELKKFALVLVQAVEALRKEFVAVKMIIAKNKEQIEELRQRMERNEENDADVAEIIDAQNRLLDIMRHDIADCKVTSDKKVKGGVYVG